MPLEVGSVFTRLGYKVDDRGEAEYKRKTAELRRQADRPVSTKAGVDVNKREFDGYKREVRGLDEEHGRLVKGSGRLKGALGSLWIGGAGVAAGGLAFAGLAKGVASAYGQFEESNKISKQTDAVLKSTGGAANMTAKQVDQLSNSLSRKTGVDDETIKSGENMLLTFTNIRNEAGRGNDIFTQSTKTINDMSAALGQDMQSSAIQLGKALNDPIKGVTALQRVGVTFDAKTKEHIKTLTEHGHRLEAQKIILHELNKEFGGSAAAQATWGDRLKVTFGNLMETIGGALAPAIEKGAKLLDGFVNGMMDGTGTGGKFVTMLKGAGGVIRDVVHVGAGLVGLFKGTSTSSSDAAKGIRSGIGSIKGTVVAVFTTLKKTIGDVVGAFRGSTKDFQIIGTRLAQVWGFAWGLVSAILRRALPGIRAMISGLAVVVRGVVDVIAGLLTLDFGRVWEGVKRIVGGAVRVVGGLIRGMTAAPREVLSRLGKWAGDLGRVALDAGKRLVSGVVGGAAHLAANLATKLADAIVAFVKWNVQIRIRAARAGADLVAAVAGKAAHLAAELWDAIKDGVGRVARLGSQMASKAADAGSAVVNGIVRTARRLPGELWDAVKGGISRLGQLERGLGTAALNAGKAIVQGIVNGIESEPGRIAHAIANMIPGPLKKVAKKIPGLGGLFAKGGKVGPFAGGARLFVAGEGDKDEWVISQEGDRRKNIGWAVDALEALTGRRVGLHRGGKGAKHKKAKKIKPILSHGQVTSAVAGQERGLANFDRDIARLERVYGQIDRENSLSVEDLVVEHDDGSTTIDEGAVKKRVIEIETQITFLKNQIGDKLRAYRTAVKSAVGVYDKVIGRLTRAIGRARGARRKNERAGYVTKRDEYRGRRAELNDKWADLGLDLEDNRLDIEELQNEEADVKGTKPTAAPPADTPDASSGAGDSGGDAGAGGSLPPPADASAPAPADTSPAPPTPEEIATAAAAEFSAFMTSRADLFSSFGGNAVPGLRAGGLVPDALGQAAGLAFLGGAGQLGVRDAAAAGLTVNIENHYGAGPGDPHTWSQQQRRQVEVALG